MHAKKWREKWWLLILIAASLILPFNMSSCVQGPTAAERVLFEHDHNATVRQYRMRTGLSTREAAIRLWQACYPQLLQYYREHPEEMGEEAIEQHSLRRAIGLVQ
jgi:hypothetical protein